jgi:DNA-binding MarR family transcriptional regulator
VTDIVKVGDAEKARIMLGLLESLERDGGTSQRRLASDLGIALGLVNAYLKRLVNKGMIKVGQAPARRYAYYLTPRGFSEKSRLTIQYLSYSLSLFRQAKQDYVMVFETALSRGYTNLVLVGVSDLSEIAAICSLNFGVRILAIVDAGAAIERFAGLRVLQTFDQLDEKADAAVITSFLDADASYERAVERLGPARVLLPALLGLSAAADSLEDQ